MRYNKTTTVNNTNIIDTFDYPKIEQDGDDIYIISKPTDRLDKLASKYYNDSSLWWVIGLTNKIFNTVNIDLGTTLCIPDIKKVYSVINKLES